MLRKEIMDTLKQTAAVACMLLVLPIVHWVNVSRFNGTTSLENYMIIGIVMDFLLLIAVLAYMMFSDENTDSAAEYLKTLPVSKWKLFWIKTLPRFSVLIILMLAFVVYIAINHTADLDILTTSFFMLIIMLALASGFFMGILADRENPVLLIVFSLLITYPILLGLGLEQMLYRKLQIDSIFLRILMDFAVIVLPSLIPIGLLIPLYKSWDCTSKKITTQRILKRLAVPAAVVAGIWGVIVF